MKKKTSIVHKQVVYSAVIDEGDNQSFAQIQQY